MVHPDAGTMLHYYNAGSQEVARFYANGDLIEFTYDELQRIKTRKLGGMLPRTETFVYDIGEGVNLIGRLAEVHDVAGTIALGYDARGREVWQKRTYLDQQAQPYITSLAYDSMGRLRNIDYPDGTTTVYRYGTNGKVARVNGLISRINYHPSGQPSEIYYAGGARQVIVYDPFSHRVKRRLVTTDGLMHHDLAYSYDNVGNVTTITDNAAAPGHLAMDREYTYDDLYRLRSFSSRQGHHEAYDYDDIGNITLHTGYSNQELVYPAAGQTSTLLGPQGEIPWQYDANGKLTVGAGFNELRWDAAQRLVWIKETNGLINKYLCSPDGNLLQRINILPDGTTETEMIINEHFAVYNGNTLRRVYVDDLLVVVTQTKQDTETIYYSITNEVNNVVGMLDEAGLFNQIEYAPYGVRLHETTSGTCYGFSAKEQVAADLLSFDVRQLHSGIGRWIQPDPLVLTTNEDVPTRPERLNLYSYAGNNPVNRIDPFGLADIDKESATKAEQQPTTPTVDEVAGEIIKKGMTKGTAISKTFAKRARAPIRGGAQGKVGSVGLTMVEGTAAFAESFLHISKHLKEFGDLEARSSGFQPIKGTLMYISPGKEQIMKIDLGLAHFADVEYGKPKLVEGKLIPVTPGYTYYHPQSKTLFWRPEQSKEWLSHTYE